MILTCPQCQAQYRLDPAMLGAAGRDVRCVTCSHMWFQIPVSAVPAASQKAEVAPPPAQETPAQSITEALQTIIEKDDAAFEAVLSTVSQSAKPKEAQPPAEDTVMPRAVSRNVRQVARAAPGAGVRWT